jgi:hypothetical protein
MIEGASEWGASLLFDADEIREKNKEVIDAEKEKLADLKSAYDGYALELKRIDQAATDSSLSEAEKRRADRLKILVKEQAETAALEDARRAAAISELGGYAREIAEIEESGRQKTRDILQAAIADDLEALNDKFLKGKIGEEDYRKEVERITLDARSRLNDEEKELLAINEKIVIDSKKKTNQKWKEEADDFVDNIVKTANQKEQDEIEKNFQESKDKLDSSLKNGLISQERYNAAIIEITKNRNEALSKLEDDKAKKDREKITSAIGGIKSAFDSITDDATGFAAKFGSTLAGGILKGFEVFNTEFANTTQGAAEKVSAWTTVIAGTINSLLGAISEGQAVALERNLENVERSFNEEASMLEELRKRGSVTEDQYARRRYEIELAAFNKSEELKKAAFDADKGLRISQTIASGAQGAVAAFASSMTIPPPAGQIIGGILAGIMGAMTLANVGIIASQQYGGGTPPQIAQPQLGGGGGGVGGQFQQPTGSQLFGTAGLFGSLGGSPQQPGQMQVRAFVVESDITNVQNTISTLQQRSEFG